MPTALTITDAANGGGFTAAVPGDRHGIVSCTDAAVIGQSGVLVECADEPGFADGGVTISGTGLYDGDQSATEGYTGRPANTFLISAEYAGDTAGGEWTSDTDPAPDPWALSAAAWDGDAGGYEWQSVGDIPLAGSLAGTLAKGFWWFVASRGGEVSDLVYAYLSGGLDAVHSRILDAVVARIQALALADVVEVRRVGVPKSIVLQTPCVLVTSFLKAETMLGGVNNRDDLGYPAYVVIVTKDAGQQDKEPRLMLWRQQISRALRAQRLPGVDEVMTCEVEPDPVIDWNPELIGYEFSGQTYRYRSREPRGFGV